MVTRILRLVGAALAAWGVLLGVAYDAAAQGPVVVYYPASPAVTYVPEVRGLFGQRLVYRPVLAAPVAVAAAPAVVVARPVTTYYAPAVSAPVTSYYAPAVPAPATTYYAPAPVAVTSYYAPAVPVLSAPAGVTAYYAPARVVVPPVVTYDPPLFVP